MDPDQNGTRRPAEGGRPSLYALVIYLPDPLRTFLDDLRLEMIPGCNPHAHVSVLPPRPLTEPPDEAIQQSLSAMAGFAPFQVQLGQIEKFNATDVIYISVERGADQLRKMHASLNHGALAFDEPYAYHPHITLAQEIPAGRVEQLLEHATRRWNEFPGPRKFLADHTVFVKNTRGNFWIDLATGPLLAAPVASTPDA